jgi:hypothetical protein
LVFKNFYDYDPVLKIPDNLPTNMTPVYITDSSSNISIATSLGWQCYYVDTFKNITDPFQMRLTIAYINCYVEKVVPELLKYKYIFICDSNVVKLDSNYTDFINKRNINKALYLTSGWYRGNHNTMERELQRSIRNIRWRYNFDQMIHATNRYMTELKKLNIDIHDTPVVSAKYIGWNISHPNKELLADYVYEEYKKHLQGNIIFSFILKLYPEYIEHYTDFKNDGAVIGHVYNR